MPEGGLGLGENFGREFGGDRILLADRGEAGYRTGRQDEEYRDDPEPETNSLWTQGRGGPDQPTQTQPRRDTEPPGPADR